MRSSFALAVLLASLPAAAQLSALGGPSSVGPATGTAPIRWPDVAYDPVNDVYLGVSGAGNIEGQYWSSAGVPIGQPFVINSGALNSMAPRVTYASGIGGFLVAWHVTLTQTSTQIQGRLIRYNQPALTNDFDISSPVTNWEMGAAMAYSPTSHEFLVAWQGPNTNIYAQRVNEQGAKVGAELNVAPSSRYHRDPAVSYSPVNDQFLVAYAGCVGNDDCFVEAQRVQAGTGVLAGTALTLDSSIAAGYTPEIAYNGITREWLVVWNRRMPTAVSFQSRRIGADGTLLAPATTVSSRYGSYDANGVAWNPVSNTFVFVTHGSNAEDAALELNALGAPMDDVGVGVGVASSNGNFNPRITANEKSAEWLAITSTAFGNLTSHRLGSLTRDTTGVPAPDAGSTEPDAGITPSDDAGTDASTEPDAGTTNSGADAGPARVDAGQGAAQGGCGCSVTALSPTLLMFVLVAVLRRRR